MSGIGNGIGWVFDKRVIGTLHVLANAGKGRSAECDVSVDGVSTSDKECRPAKLETTPSTTGHPGRESGHAGSKR